MNENLEKTSQLNDSELIINVTGETVLVDYGRKICNTQIEAINKKISNLEAIYSKNEKDFIGSKDDKLSNAEFLSMQRSLILQIKQLKTERGNYLKILKDKSLLKKFIAEKIIKRYERLAKKFIQKPRTKVFRDSIRLLEATGKVLSFKRFVDLFQTKFGISQENLEILMVQVNKFYNKILFSLINWLIHLSVIDLEPRTKFIVLNTILHLDYTWEKRQADSIHEFPLFCINSTIPALTQFQHVIQLSQRNDFDKIEQIYGSIVAGLAKKNNYTDLLKFFYFKMISQSQQELTSDYSPGEFGPLHLFNFSNSNLVNRFAQSNQLASFCSTTPKICISRHSYAHDYLDNGSIYILPKCITDTYGNKIFRATVVVYANNSGVVKEMSGSGPNQTLTIADLNQMSYLIDHIPNLDVFLKQNHDKYARSYKFALINDTIERSNLESDLRIDNFTDISQNDIDFLHSKIDIFGQPQRNEITNNINRQRIDIYNKLIGTNVYIRQKMIIYFGKEKFDMHLINYLDSQLPPELKNIHNNYLKLILSPGFKM